MNFTIDNILSNDFMLNKKKCNYINSNNISISIDKNKIIIDFSSNNVNIFLNNSDNLEIKNYNESKYFNDLKLSLNFPIESNVLNSSYLIYR